MAYDLATVTNSGNQLLASVVSDHSSLVIDKIEVSGTKLTSSTDLSSMTSISNVVKTLSANGYQKTVPSGTTYPAVPIKERVTVAANDCLRIKF